MDKIIFEDLPSQNTPINAKNLNKLQDNVEKEFLLQEGQLENLTSHISDVSTNKLQKQLKMCTFDFEGNFYFDVDAYNEIGTIPSEYVPKNLEYVGGNLMYFIVQCSGMTVILQGKITNDGKIHIYVSSSFLDVIAGGVQIRIHTNWFTN